MSRKKYKKRNLEGDPVYQNAQIAKFINYIMERGKKSVARKIVYDALNIIKEQTKKDPIEVFEKSITNVAPLIEVRSKRVGGATYQVPVQIKDSRKEALAFSWIIEAASSKKGKPMREKLAEELLAAFKGEGTAVKKRENTHRMAEANRAFAHFAW